MLDFRQSLINSTLRKVLKRLHFPLEVMLTCVRWYVAYPPQPSPYRENDGGARGFC